ncbi:hypothetical protein H5410_007747 [Solanum commersonii]|uniref:DUF4283 domain-containing protein n=1 Tax=Solanum commersonii TaxID=4109 RepID=A0A9J6ADM8_SOLCO|nr:hypothetical protein H5410_007747 [Solanum commersonii]
MAATATGRPLFEVVQPAPLSQTTTHAIFVNFNTINPKQSALINSKTITKSIEIIHREPTITFSIEERQDFMVEEGLYQEVVFKLSHGAPDLKVLRSILPKHFVNYLLYNGEEHQCRVFPWSIGYNPKEETTLAAVWISLPNLSPDLFANKSLLSIASAVRKPIAIDKGTQMKSRPSTTRVKAILDLMKKLPNCIRLKFVDGKSGKLIEVFQEIVYDNLPLYCNYCKHQGHNEYSCRLISKRNQNNKQIDNTIEVASKGTIDSEKYQGDAREILNEKRKVVDVNQSKATSLDRQLVAVTSEQNHAHSMNVITSNIGVQTTTENKGGTPRVGVDASRVGSGKKIMDSGHKLMDTSDVEDAENSGQHVLQTTGKQVKLTENDNDLIQEKQVSPPTLNSKLSSEALVFVPKCMIAKKNESRASVSYTIDLGEDSLDEVEEDNMLDLGRGFS